MDEDWDLFAIVRSCQSPTNTTTKESPFTTTNNTTQSSISSSNFKVELEYEAFSFPNIVQPITNEIQELNQLFTSFNPTTTNTTTTTTSHNGINPNSPNNIARSIGQQQHHPPSTNWPHFVQEASNSTFNTQQLQQQNQKQEFQLLQNNSSIVFPNTQPQTPRSRKRKSQQGKMVCHVTADNLSADLWAWRKYGQKPIKGSPYPRNYYRCSSSKGCTARKQVERSNTEAEMFIVTYTGDHTHPRPTHRNSLAGSTRTKSPAMLPSPSTSSQPNNITSPSSSSSAPYSLVEEEEDIDMEIETDEEGEDGDDIPLPSHGQ